MEFVRGRRYRVVVKYPWGERKEGIAEGVVRESDGTIRWTSAEDLGLEPCLDCVLQEAETWILGWAGGTCDVTVVLSEGPDAPEP